MKGRTKIAQVEPENEISFLLGTRMFWGAGHWPGFLVEFNRIIHIQDILWNIFFFFANLIAMFVSVTQGMTKT